MAKQLNPKQQARRIVHNSRRVRAALKHRLSVTRNYLFSIDSPRKKQQEQRHIVVEGWIIPKKSKAFEMRVRNNQRVYPVKTGLKRLDVANSYPDLDPSLALHSGFKAEFDFEDGLITVEIRSSGSNFKTLYTIKVLYGVENLPAIIYNKELSNNYPEHVNLIENREKFYYEDRLEPNIIRHQKDARLMAMYLPQFHPFEENDKAWGRGFTEWNNVTTGQPRFIGHLQPILPKDLGFYDLRYEPKILEQIELAKKYGIYGFCFYYYWFSGRKIMDKPIESFISHKDWDFNFAICWANENWTKRWDGRDDEIIIAQEYKEDDPLTFIKDVEHILLDERYITEDGKPVLMVYRASELKDPSAYTKTWRRYFKEKHNKELQLVAFLSFDNQDPRDYGFDVALDFAPLSSFFKNHLFDNNSFPFVDVGNKLLDINFDGVVADYRRLAINEKLSMAYEFPVYHCVTPSWDNDARKKGKGFIFQHSNPDLYAEWLKRLIVEEQKVKDAPLIFINAWNEWAEGAILEPSMHLGHASLNRTAEVLAGASHNKENATNFPSYGLRKSPSVRLAVVVHLYYVDVWPDIKKRLETIDEPYDLFVTLNGRDKDFNVTLSDKKIKIYSYILPNRGRDVLPFLFVLRRIQAAGYEYVLKLHSKKSPHRSDGSSWFEEVLDSLLPDTATVKSIYQHLEQPDTGMIGPKHHLVSLKRHMGSNAHILKHLLSRVYNGHIAEKVIAQPEKYPYFGGTMFWARLDALEGILKLQLMPDDFQSEHGQIDGTTAHAIERMLGAVCKLDDKKLYEVDGQGVHVFDREEITEKYKYAP